MKTWTEDHEFSVLGACEDLHGFAQGHLQAMPGEVMETARVLEERLASWRPPTRDSEPYDDIVRALAHRALVEYKESLR